MATAIANKMGRLSIIAPPAAMSKAAIGLCIQCRRAQGEVFHSFFPEGDDAFADPEGGHRHEEVVGDLRAGE